MPPYCTDAIRVHRSSMVFGTPEACPVVWVAHGTWCAIGIGADSVPVPIPPSGVWRLRGGCGSRFGVSIRFEWLGEVSVSEPEPRCVQSSTSGDFDALALASGVGPAVVCKETADFGAAVAAVLVAPEGE